jgi:hypothetical protein
LRLCALSVIGCRLSEALGRQLLPICGVHDADRDKNHQSDDFRDVIDVICDDDLSSFDSKSATFKTICHRPIRNRQLLRRFVIVRFEIGILLRRFVIVRFEIGIF